MKMIKELLPGFAVCVIIAVIGQCIAMFVPTVGSALFAIFIGMFCGNTFLNKPIFNKGTKFSESKLLEVSIVLTGLTLQISDILNIGINGIVFIMCQMFLTIASVYILGRLLKFNKRFSLCMCAGNAVCGSSAIGTIAPIVKADSAEKGISITVVNVMGTVLMITLPLLTGVIFPGSAVKTSAMIGGTLQSIGQVIAAGKLVSETVTQMSTVFKIVRIVFLVVVAFVFAKMNTNEGEKLFSSSGNSETKVKAGVPWFILGFFALCIVTAFGIVPSFVSVGAKAISNQFEIIALAAIGMRVKFKDIVREGPKAIAYGGLVALCQVTFAFILIELLIK